MKRYLTVILFICFIVSSCAKISYNSNTGDYSYFRLGDQRLEGFKVESGEFKAGLDKQESDAEALLKAVQVMEKLTGLVLMP